jgi:FKBP-type peptidyl-prolyl cis-trans isomerases 2
MSDDQAAEAANDPAEADDATETEETAADASEDVAESDAPTGLQDGDFARIAYTIRTAEDGRVVDTTDPDVAEESAIDHEDHDFEPRTISLGAGHVFPPVEDAFEGAEPGAEGTVEIPPGEAFGEFENDEVQTVSADKLQDDDKYPGAQVTIDGEQGHVEAIIGGRARVDFNHPLAGEELEYEYEILDTVEDTEKQAASMLGMYLQEAPDVRIETEQEEEETTIPAEDDDEEPETEIETVEKDVLYIEASPQMAMISSGCSPNSRSPRHDG